MSDWRTEHEHLQRAGANACALGRSELDNPFLRSAACPAATGETLDVWMAKYDAWHLGFTLEALMRRR